MGNGKENKEGWNLRKVRNQICATLRKVVKKFEVSQHATYVSPFCGKTSVKRQAAGIWRCKRTGKKMAGGAYQLATTAAVTAKATIQRLRRLRDEAKLEN